MYQQYRGGIRRLRATGMMQSVGDEARKAVLPSNEPPVVETSQEEFSPLDLRDRVVVMAIFYEIVKLEHVEKAWRRWSKMQQKGSNDSLWNILVQEPGVNRDAIYEVAAQIYGFEIADINRLRALALIRDVSESFSQEQWQSMIQLLVIPIAVGEDPRSGHARLIFATHDPTRPEVARLLQSFNLTSFDLRYAAPSVISELFNEIFPPEVQDLPFWQEEELVEEVAMPQKVEPEPIKAARVPAELDHHSLVDWFESVLIATYREKASEAHIFLNDKRELEIHFRVDGGLRLWRKEDTFHPEGLLAYVMDSIIKVHDFEPGVAMEVSFQRWIERDLTRFHITIQPDNDSEDLKAATVVIRLLGHREMSEGGMGPWKAH